MFKHATETAYSSEIAGFVLSFKRWNWTPQFKMLQANNIDRKSVFGHATKLPIRYDMKGTDEDPGPPI